MIFQIERSKIVLCLISPTYIASKVCQEEYNLAMALNCDPSYGTVLFPILVEPVDVLPSWCRRYLPLDFTNSNISKLLGEVKLLKGKSIVFMLIVGRAVTDIQCDIPIGFMFNCNLKVT